MATSTLCQLPAKHPSSGRRHQCLPSPALKLIPCCSPPISSISPSCLCFFPCAPNFLGRVCCWGIPAEERGAVIQPDVPDGAQSPHKAPTQPNQPQDHQEDGGETQQGKFSGKSLVLHSSWAVGKKARLLDSLSRCHSSVPSSTTGAAGMTAAGFSWHFNSNPFLGVSSTSLGHSAAEAQRGEEQRIHRWCQNPGQEEFLH